MADSGEVEGVGTGGRPITVIPGFPPKQYAPQSIKDFDVDKSAHKKVMINDELVKVKTMYKALYQYTSNLLERADGAGMETPEQIAGTIGQLEARATEALRRATDAEATTQQLLRQLDEDVEQGEASDGGGGQTTRINKLTTEVKQLNDVINQQMADKRALADERDAAKIEQKGTVTKLNTLVDTLKDEADKLRDRYKQSQDRVADLQNEQLAQPRTRVPAADIKLTAEYQEMLLKLSNAAAQLKLATENTEDWKRQTQYLQGQVDSYKRRTADAVADQERADQQLEKMRTAYREGMALREAIDKVNRESEQTAERLEQDLREKKRQVEDLLQEMDDANRENRPPTATPFRSRYGRLTLPSSRRTDRSKSPTGHSSSIQVEGVERIQIGRQQAENLQETKPTLIDDDVGRGKERTADSQRSRSNSRGDDRQHRRRDQSNDSQQSEATVQPTATRQGERRPAPARPSDQPDVVVEGAQSGQHNQHHSGKSHARKNLAVPKYSGTPSDRSWDKWFLAFNRFLRIQNEDDPDLKLCWLTEALTGSALGALDAMPDTIADNYGEIITRLEKRFRKDVALGEGAAQAKFVACQHQYLKGESVLDYGTNLQILAKAAYPRPEQEDAMRKHLAVQFTNGIDNRFKLKAGYGTNLDFEARFAKALFEEDRQRQLDDLKASQKAAETGHSQSSKKMGEAKRSQKPLGRDDQGKSNQPKEGGESQTGTAGPRYKFDGSPADSAELHYKVGWSVCFRCTDEAGNRLYHRELADCKIPRRSSTPGGRFDGDYRGGSGPSSSRGGYRTWENRYSGATPTNGPTGTTSAGQASNASALAGTTLQPTRASILAEAGMGAVKMGILSVHPAQVKQPMVTLWLGPEGSNKLKVEAMVDTGCESSCMSHALSVQYAKAMKNDVDLLDAFKAATLMMTGVGGELIEIDTALSVPITMGNKQVDALIYVMPKGVKQYDFILGMNLLEDHFQLNTTFADAKFQRLMGKASDLVAVPEGGRVVERAKELLGMLYDVLHSARPAAEAVPTALAGAAPAAAPGRNISRVTLDKRFKVAAGCCGTMTLTADRSTYDTLGDYVYFRPNRLLLREYGIDCQDAILNVPKGNRLKLEATNISDQQVRLKPGEVIGFFEEAEIVIEKAIDHRDPGSTANGSGRDGEVKPGDAASKSAAANSTQRENLRCYDPAYPLGSTSRKEKLLELIDLSNTSMTADEQGRMRQLLTDNSDLFALNSNERGECDMVEHVINTGDALPIRQQLRRAALTQRPIIEDHIKKLLQTNCIVPSQSAWASPVVLARKKDQTWRFCVDYRKVNAVTKKTASVLPRMDDLTDNIRNKGYKTTMDLQMGYHQMKLDPGTQDRSAFATHMGLFEYRVLPFGLALAPNSWSRLMDMIMDGINTPDISGKHSTVSGDSSYINYYMDDIMVASERFDDHLNDLQAVFQRLRKGGMLLKPPKCRFASKTVQFLGYKITEHGVTPLIDHTEAVRNFPVPTTVKHCQCFLGLCGWMRKFVDNYATTVDPIARLLRKEAKGKKFEWTAEAQEAFEKMKAALVSPPVLQYPDKGKPWRIETDWSGVAVGAALMQQDEEGRWHPVSYASRALDGAERNYGITKAETLAVVWALSHFRPYILGSSEITVYTDHSATGAMLLGTGKLAAIFVRWIETVAEFMPQIIYRPGAKNAGADALSRLPQYDVEEDGERSYRGPDIKQCFQWDPVPEYEKIKETMRVRAANAQMCPIMVKARKAATVPGGETAPTPAVRSEQGGGNDGQAPISTVLCDDQQPGERDYDPTAATRQEQLTDVVLADMIAFFEQGKLPTDKTALGICKREAHDFEVWHGLLFNKADDATDGKRLAVPQAARRTLFNEHHDKGHFGVKRTWAQLRSEYWWPHMHTDLYNWSHECFRCAKWNPGRKGIPPMTRNPIVGPFERVHIDILELPECRDTMNKHAVVLIDSLTKWPEVYAIRDQTAATIADCFRDFCARHSAPLVLFSDNGSNLTSNLFQKVAQLLHSQQVTTTAKHQQANGIVERFNKTLMGMLAKFGERYTDTWDTKLSDVLGAYRMSVNSTTGYAPFTLVYGRQPNMPTKTAMSRPRSSVDGDIDDYAMNLVVSLSEAWRLARDQSETAGVVSKALYDRAAKPPRFKAGDRAYLHNDDLSSGPGYKLLHEFDGPFLVEAVTDTYNARIRHLAHNEGQTQLVAMERLRPVWKQLPDIDPEYVQPRQRAAPHIRPMIEVTHLEPGHQHNTRYRKAIGDRGQVQGNMGAEPDQAITGGTARNSNEFRAPILNGSALRPATPRPVFGPTGSHLPTTACLRHVASSTILAAVEENMAGHGNTPTHFAAEWSLLDDLDGDIKRRARPRKGQRSATDGSVQQLHTPEVRGRPSASVKPPVPVKPMHLQQVADQGARPDQLGVPRRIASSIVDTEALMQTPARELPVTPEGACAQLPSYLRELVARASTSFGRQKVGGLANVRDLTETLVQQTPAEARARVEADLRTLGTTLIASGSTTAYIEAALSECHRQQLATIAAQPAAASAAQVDGSTSAALPDTADRDRALKVKLGEIRQQVQGDSDEGSVDDDRVYDSDGGGDQRPAPADGGGGGAQPKPATVGASAVSVPTAIDDLDELILDYDEDGPMVAGTAEQTATPVADPEGLLQDYDDGHDPSGAGAADPPNDVLWIDLDDDQQSEQAADTDEQLGCPGAPPVTYEVRAGVVFAANVRMRKRIHVRGKNRRARFAPERAVIVGGTPASALDQAANCAGIEHWHCSHVRLGDLISGLEHNDARLRVPSIAIARLAVVLARTRKDAHLTIVRRLLAPHGLAEPAQLFYSELVQLDEDDRDVQPLPVDAPELITAVHLFATRCDPFREALRATELWPIFDVTVALSREGSPQAAGGYPLNVYREVEAITGYAFALELARHQLFFSGIYPIRATGLILIVGDSTAEALHTACQAAAPQTLKAVRDGDVAALKLSVRSVYCFSSVTHIVMCCRLPLPTEGETAEQLARTYMAVMNNEEQRPAHGQRLVLMGPVPAPGDERRCRAVNEQLTRLWTAGPHVKLIADYSAMFIGTRADPTLWTSSGKRLNCHGALKLALILQANQVPVAPWMQSLNQNTMYRNTRFSGYGDGRPVKRDAAYQEVRHAGDRYGGPPDKRARMALATRAFDSRIRRSAPGDGVDRPSRYRDDGDRRDYGAADGTNRRDHRSTDREGYGAHGGHDSDKDEGGVPFRRRRSGEPRSGC